MESLPRRGLPNIPTFFSLFGAWNQGFPLLLVNSRLYLVANLSLLCLDKGGREGPRDFFRIP